MIGPYKTATAFRVALEERLRQRALESGTPLDRLRKEIAFQRLFARMTAGDAADGWVLKGAQVLLIRLDERARATKDADTTWRHEASELQAALGEAMELELGDGFSFEIGTRTRLEAETEDGGWRYSVRSRLDGRFFEQFVLDVNVSPNDLRSVDQLTFRPVLDFAGLEPPTIAAVSIAFHLAEKLHAYVRIYSGSRPSSRVKDLYDMLVMARALPMPTSDALHEAVSTTFFLRNTPLPTALPDPPPMWAAPWAAYVRDYGIEWTTLDDAVAALRPLWTPVTAPSEARRTWEPERWDWSTRPLR